MNQDEVQRVIDKYPEAFKCAHTGRSCTDDFIKLLAMELHAKWPEIGLNGKRGDYDDISDDALAVMLPEGATDYDCIDQLTGNPIIVVDVIAGAGGPNPGAAWARVGCGRGNPGAWVKPSEMSEQPSPTPTPKPTPCPPPPPKPAYPGDRFFDRVGEMLEADYREAGQSLNAQSATWFARTIWDHINEGLSLDESLTKHRREWREVLGLH